MYIIFFFSCTSIQKKQSVQTDILVIGGGVSGVSAALQAARMGESVIIVEESPWLGGMFTSAGVTAIQGNSNLPSGIWGEFLDKLIHHYGSKEALSTGWASPIQFEPKVGKDIIQQLIADESNIIVFYGYWIKDVIKTANSLQQVVFINKEDELLEVNAKLFIEATEYGDLLALAGEDYSIGLESALETGEEWAIKESYPFIQDLTYVAILNDLGNGKDNLIDKPNNYNPNDFKCLCIQTCDDNSKKNVLDCKKVLEYGKLPNNKYMINWPKNGNDYFINILEMSRDERLIELEKAKNHTLSFIYFMQNVAGMKHLAIEYEFGTDDGLALIPYLRESRRLKGELILNLNDIINPYANKEKPLFKAAIAVGDYTLHHHRQKNPIPKELELPKIPSYSIPLTSLMAKNTINLIIAEKSISVTSFVNGTSRYHPVVFEIGQAAGALAVIALQERVYPKNVNIRLVQQVLLDYGCWLIPYFDTNPADEYFQEVQRIATSGLMRGEFNEEVKEGVTRFYPDQIAIKKELSDALTLLGHTVYIEDSNSLTRADLVLNLWNALDKPSANPVDLDYSDVKRNSELFKALSYFNSEDLNSMWLEQETFGQNETVKRWELAVWLDKVFEPYLNELYLSTYIEKD
ncbi:MAG: FAD-dependent oxidoreductase [Bacteroidetes bacterium]|nr:FAD-dependent oxidoreductase [Bacteroidota bacterium]